MIVIGLMFLTCFYIIILYKKHRYILDKLPKSRESIKYLYKNFRNDANKREIIKVYLPAIVSLLVLVLLALLMNVRFTYMLMLLFVQLAIVPLIIHWHFINHKNIREYRNLCLYLSQLILIFKSNHKILSSLEEMENTMDPFINSQIEKMIAAIKDGASNQAALSMMSDIYPHFILHNLHALLVNVERYGSDNYYYALNLIQDDIDDWLEDLELYYDMKAKLLRKVNILIGFAYLISFIAIRMLFSVSMDMNDHLYQQAIFTFAIIEIFTFVIAQSLLKDDFISASEVI